MTGMQSRVLALGVVAALCALTGCEGDAFESATPIKAPRASAEGPAQATGVGARPPTSGQVAPPATGAAGAPGAPGTQMPADHPPVGSTPVAAGPLPKDLAPRPRVPASAGAPTQYGKTGPLRWTAPDAWKAVRSSSQMRLAEYVAMGAQGQEPASVTVFYFGPGGGGGVEANVSRWIGQVKTADGKPAQATRGEKTVNGMTVHTVDAAGVFDAGAAMQGAGAKSGQRLLGAIVESPAGLFFFKMVGPKETVDANVASWDALVSSFTPGA